MGKRLWLFLTACVLSVSMAFAQKSVTGKVVDALTGEPVVGASVLVKGTTIGQATDINGDFTITNVPNSAKTLRISYIGLKDQEVTIKSKVRVYMQPETTETDEVMVVAYGTATKSSFTGSASVIKAEEIEQTQKTNVLDALNGKSAGVQMFNASGQPGQTSPTIRIRGISSINAGNAPLIVLDGAPYAGDLNNLNPMDIESITVLKDAASTALYGSRAANGVIIVTTKQAKVGENAKISVDLKWGQNSRSTRRYETINDPALYYETYFQGLKNYAVNTKGLSADQAYIWANENLVDGGYGLQYGIYNVPQGQYLIGTNGKLNPLATMGRVVDYNGEKYLLKADDWMDNAYHKSLRQEYNVNVQNATDHVNYYASFGYLNTQGITDNSNFERINGRLKADSQLKDWLKVGGNMAFVHYEAKSMSEDGSSNSSGNPIAVAMTTAPIYPLFIRNADGSVKYDAYGNKMYDYGDGGNAGLERQQWTGTNALSDALLNQNAFEGNAFNAVGFAEVRFLKDFTFTTTNTVTVDETRSHDVTNPYYGNYASSNGITYVAHSRGYVYNFEQMLSWGHQFGAHKVDVTLAHDAYRSKSYSLSGQKSNMFDPNNFELNNAITDGTPGSSRSTYNNERFIARALYDYDQKYFLQAFFSRDGSSRFSSKDDIWWGNFWSGGAAWIISKEKWFPHNKGIDLLKLKTSYGEIGNDNISNFLYTNTYSIVNTYGSPAVIPNGKGNDKITWEKNANFNVGLEFELLKGRLNGSVEFFYRKTSNMLSWFTFAPSWGYPGEWANIGDMRNRGIEFEATGHIFKSKDFNWNIFLNLTHYRNKVTYLDPQRKTMTVDGVDGYPSGNYFYGEGKPLYTYRLYKFAGVNPETGQSRWYTRNTDADGKEVIGTTEDYAELKSKDYFLCGTAQPDVYGGFGTTVEFKGFDFSINFAYQIGGQVYDSDYQGMMENPVPNGVGGAMHADVLKAWSSTNTSSNIPFYIYDEQNVTYANASSDRWLTDASYLSINNINLGYTLPLSITRRLQLSKLRVYCSADNVFLWSKRQGLDPRQGIGASTASYYAPIRAISGGISITF